MSDPWDRQAHRRSSRDWARRGARRWLPGLVGKRKESGDQRGWLPISHCEIAPFHGACG
jgi:hypothetical protein